jgi:uncharacterized protein (DUF4213/DUF364 family)
MGVLEEIIGTLPEDLPPLRDIRVGPFWTAAWTDNASIAITIRPSRPPADGFPIPNAGELLDIPTSEIVHWALSPVPIRASIGMAVLNSILLPAPDLEVEIKAQDILMEEGAGKPIALVGHFPFVDELRKVADPLWVLELDPREGDLEASRASEVIPKSEIVAITSSAFVNHTIDELLALSKNARIVMLLGGSTPLSPILLEKGIDFVAGVRAFDPQRLLQSAGQGATFRQLQGIKLVTLVRNR